MVMSEVILNSVKKNNGVRTSAIAKFFIAIFVNYGFRGGREQLA
jgi:hypothetical protein